MNRKINRSLKNPAKASMIISILFFSGIFTSALMMGMLPIDLALKTHVAGIEKAWPVLGPFYFAIALTFLLGVAALVVGGLNKKEIIVYLEKKKGAREAAVKEQMDAQDGNLVKAVRQAMTGAETDAIERGLQTLCKGIDAGQGAVYAARQTNEKRFVEFASGFAFSKSESAKLEYEFGEGLIGQAALSGHSLYLDEIPEGYITILSGLGSATARYLFIVALRHGDELKGVLEVATFSPLTNPVRKQIEDIAQLMAEKIS
jgi:methyl-accepting chemotaxis protein